METAITEIAKAIVEKPISYAWKETMLAKHLNSHINRLMETRATIEAAILDANSSRSCSHSQKDTLDKLDGALTELVDFLDEQATRAKRRELLGGSRLTTEVRWFFSPSNPIVARFKDARKLKNIRGELDFIAKNHNQFGTIFSMLSERKTQTLSQETGSYPNTDVIIGREKERDDLIALLCDSSNDLESLSVVTIVGIGGQGKTTLAQYVFNDQRVIDCFEVRLWVFATQNFSLKEVLEKIIADATDKKPFDCEMTQLQRQILKEIRGKKFLLVLDNLWDQDKLCANWLELKALLGVGASGSKVLVTTRSNSVARIMGPFNDPYMLHDLAKVDSWLLFKHFALRGCQELGLEKIGKEIVAMCPRVPLVLRVVGQQLAQCPTVKQWSSFKDKLAAKSSFEELDIIMQTLKLSYDQLDEKLKLCVAYCSLFPKGTWYDADKMVRIWIALGYVEAGNQSLEDIGEEYVLKLASRGFFKYSSSNQINCIGRFTMHDLIHDLMILITQSKYQMVSFGRNKIDEKVTHVSFLIENFDLEYDKVDWEALFLECHIKQQLRSILMIKTRDNGTIIFRSISDKLLAGFQGLKVLDLHGLKIEKVPSSLGALSCLKYLDLSKNPMRKLPKSITQLVNLLSLNLSECFFLQELPRDIGKMYKLRHLLKKGCDSLTYMPKGFGKLKDLHNLDWFIVGEDSSCSRRCKVNVAGGLAELSDINNIRGDEWGRFTIYVAVESKYIVSQGRTGHLGRKDKLTALDIEFKKSAKEDEKVLEDLRPQGANLRYLNIEGYGGEKLPSWMMIDQLHFHLPNLIKINYEDSAGSSLQLDSSVEFGTRGKLCSLKIEKKLPDESKDASPSPSPSGESEKHQPLFLINTWFPNLEELMIMGIPDLEAFMGKFQDLFSLVNLEIKNSPILEIPDGIGTLTSLQFLEINTCQVKAIPDSIGNLTSLQKMHIENCPKLKAIPDSIGSLTSLQHLYIENCSKLKAIPDSIGSLTSLQHLYIENCSKLKAIPDSIGSLNFLQHLHMENCPKLKAIPDSIGYLTSLQYLEIFRCPKLKAIPYSIGSLTSLEYLEIEGCLKVKAIPDSIGSLTSLKDLSIKRCSVKAMPDSIGSLTSIKVICITNCPKMVSLPHQISKLSQLVVLSIHGCSKVLVERCRKPTGELWPFIQHIPFISIGFYGDEKDEYDKFIYSKYDQ